MSPFFRNAFLDIEIACNPDSDPNLPASYYNHTAPTMYPSPTYGFSDRQAVFPAPSNNNNNNNNYFNCVLPAPQQQQTVNYQQVTTPTTLLSTLHMAASNGDSATVEEIVRIGGIGLINRQDEEGITALHSAAKYGRHNVLLSLLRWGANPNILTLEGESALHLAVASSDEQSVQQLLSGGAFVNIQDDEGDSPLHWAVREGNSRLLELLLTHGAHVNAANEDGETPLHLAASLGEKKLARALIARGAQIEIQDASGATPLQEAYANEHFDLAKELSAMLSANPFARARTPCEVAPQQNRCSFSSVDKTEMPQEEAYHPFHRSVVAASF